jgi:sugar phosphate isomerase/epimerase
MRIGAPMFVRPSDPKELAKAHVERGYRAAYCPIPNDPGQRAQIRQAFAEADVVLAEVGAYCINLLDTDEEKRRKNIEEVSRRLRLADEMAARCCVVHGGTVQAGGWGKFAPENFAPKTFEKLVATIQAILDAVQPKTARLSIEIEPYTLPDSPQSYRELIDAVNRPGLGVHFDPVNSIATPRALAQSGAWLRGYFEKVGPWIVSCHAKDMVLTREGEVASRWGLKEVPPGQGFLDYEAFVKGVASLPLDPPVMIEHLKTEQDYAAARDFIVGAARPIGVKVVQ